MMYSTALVVTTTHVIYTAKNVIVVHELFLLGSITDWKGASNIGPGPFEMKCRIGKMYEQKKRNVGIELYDNYN